MPLAEFSQSRGTEVGMHALLGLLYKGTNRIQEGRTLMTPLFSPKHHFLIDDSVSTYEGRHTNVLALVKEVAGHSSLDEGMR